MFTLLFLVLLIAFAGVVFALSIAAIPIIAVVIAIGLVFSIISIIFKFIFGGPLFIIMIILAIVHFSKYKNKF